jgi:hypothetical protein
VVPLVEGVDHVYVPVVDASTVFAGLVEELRLPVLWPFTTFGSFASGGVSIGSIKLEVLESNDVSPWSLAQDPPQVQGVAFRPARGIDDGFLAELDSRGLGHSDPEHFERDGRPAWTNVYLDALVSDRAGAFVCDYHLPESKDVHRRRQLLQDCDGGRLGVLDAAELTVVTRDSEVTRRRWQALLDPLRPDPPGTWRLPLGPAVRVVEGDDERVGELALAVRSVQEAEGVWAATDPALTRLPLGFLAGNTSPAG